MTLWEAFEAGHRRIRLPAWLPGNYLELKDLGGFLGPWVELFFPPAGLEEYECPLTQPSFQCERSDYVPYDGPEIPPRPGLRL